MIVRLVAWIRARLRRRQPPRGWQPVRGLNPEHVLIRPLTLEEWRAPRAWAEEESTPNIRTRRERERARARGYTIPPKERW